MDKTKQPGTEIDAALWERFRDDVERRHGSVRGNLRNDLEAAIRDFLRVSDEATPAELNRRLQRIEAAVGAAESDGGTETSTECDAVHTHTPATKPSPNATRQAKVTYLIERKYDRDGGSVLAEDIIHDVKEVYGFEDRTAETYVQPVIDALDARRHPDNDALLVWGSVADDVRTEYGETES